MRKKVAEWPAAPDGLCDLCRGTEYDLVERDLVDTALGGKELFQFYGCCGCGLVRLWPRPASDALARHYPAEYIPYKRSHLLIAAVNGIRWRLAEKRLRSALGGIGSVLEVGCARGEFLEFLSRRGWRAAGIEMDRQSAAVARRISGLSVWQGKFEEFPVAAGARFDCFLMFFLLEHLPSPKEGLRRASALLRPGGIAVVKIPNFNSWERRIFGRWWHCYDVPRHFHIFTRDHMYSYARQTGFAVESVRYAAVPNDWIGGIARMLKEKGYERLARFFTYRSPLLWPIFFPGAAVGALFRRSSRFTFILRKI